MNSFSIENYRHDLEVIRDTVAQIKKDFSMFDFDITFSGNEKTAYQELKSQLIPLFDKLLARETEKVFALLYRIDVSEKLIKQIPETVSFAEHIAQLVLERELLKVVNRKLYGNS